MLKKYTHVIWDWNGTLLDDAQLCFNVINNLLTNRNLPAIKDISTYKDIFGFPIIDYYKRAGFDFDKEPFEVTAANFIKLYHSDKSRFHLFDSAADVILAIKKSGLRQIVLSASDRNSLHSQMEPFDIKPYFDEIIGISNIYGTSKMSVGAEYMGRNNISKSKTVLVGDTTHDFEVATALGIDCILIPNGHQNKHRLFKCGVPVLDNLSQTLDYIT